MPYQKQKLALTIIYSQATDDINPYGLNFEEKENLKVVIEGLKQIILQIDTFKCSRDGHVDLAVGRAHPLPFHLKNFSDQQHIRNYLEKPMAEKKAYLLNTIKENTSQSMEVKNQYFIGIEALFDRAKTIYPKKIEINKLVKIHYKACDEYEINKKIHAEQENSIIKEYLQEELRKEKKSLFKSKEFINTKVEVITVLNNQQEDLIKYLLQLLPFRKVLLDNLDDNLREKMIINNTVNEFITEFNKVQKQGPKTVKNFISKLGGDEAICLDAKMRAALDYASLSDIYHFTEVLHEVISSLEDDQQSYFKIAEKLMLHPAWGQEYSADNYTDRGEFNESCFPVLDRILHKDLSHQPGLEFTEILGGQLTLTPSETAISYLHFILYADKKHDLIKRLAEKSAEQYQLFVSQVFHLREKYEITENRLVDHQLLVNLSDDHFPQVYLAYFDTLPYEQLELFKDLTARLWDLFLNDKIWLLIKVLETHGVHFLKFLAKTGNKEQIIRFYLRHELNDDHSCIWISVTAGTYRNWAAFKLLFHGSCLEMREIESQDFIESNVEKVLAVKHIFCLALLDEEWDIAFSLISLLRFIDKIKDPSQSSSLPIFEMGNHNTMIKKEKILEYLLFNLSHLLSYYELESTTLDMSTGITYEDLPEIISQALQAILSSFTKEEISLLMHSALADKIRELHLKHQLMLPSSVLHYWDESLVHFYVTDNNFKALILLLESGHINLKVLHPHIFNLKPSDLEDLCGINFGGHNILHKIMILGDLNLRNSVVEAIFSKMNRSETKKLLLALDSFYLTPLSYAVINNNASHFDLFLKFLLREKYDQCEILRLLRGKPFNIKTPCLLERIITLPSSEFFDILLRYLEPVIFSRALKATLFYSTTPTGNVRYTVPNLLSRLSLLNNHLPYERLIGAIEDLPTVLTDKLNKDEMGVLPLGFVENHPESFVKITQKVAEEILVNSLTRLIKKLALNEFKQYSTAAAEIIKSWPLPSFNKISLAKLEQLIIAIISLRQFELLRILFTKISKENFKNLIAHMDRSTLIRLHAMAIAEGDFKSAIPFRNVLLNDFINLPPAHLSRDLFILIIHFKSNIDGYLALERLLPYCTKETVTRLFSVALPLSDNFLSSLSNLPFPSFKYLLDQLPKEMVLNTLLPHLEDINVIRQFILAQISSGQPSTQFLIELLSHLDSERLNKILDKVSYKQELDELTHFILGLVNQSSEWLELLILKTCHFKMHNYILHNFLRLSPTLIYLNPILLLDVISEQIEHFNKKDLENIIILKKNLQDPEGSMEKMPSRFINLLKEAIPQNSNNIYYHNLLIPLLDKSINKFKLKLKNKRFSTYADRKMMDDLLILVARVKLSLVQHLSVGGDCYVLDYIEQAKRALAEISDFSNLSNEDKILFRVHLEHRHVILHPTHPGLRLFDRPRAGTFDSELNKLLTLRDELLRISDDYMQHLFKDIVKLSYEQLMEITQMDKKLWDEKRTTSNSDVLELSSHPICGDSLTFSLHPSSLPLLARIYKMDSLAKLACVYSLKKMLEESPVRSASALAACFEKFTLAFNEKDNIETIKHARSMEGKIFGSHGEKFINACQKIIKDLPICKQADLSRVRPKPLRGYLWLSQGNTH